MQKTLIYIDINTKQHILPNGAIADRTALLPKIERGQWGILCFQFVRKSESIDGVTLEPVDLSKDGGSFIFVADNNFLDDDSLMLKSLQTTTPFDEENPTSNMINIEGDWVYDQTFYDILYELGKKYLAIIHDIPEEEVPEELIIEFVESKLKDSRTADLSLGQISVRYNSDTVKFREVMGDRETSSSNLYMSIKKYIPGLSNPSTLSWSKFVAVNTVRDWDSAQVIPPSGVEYISYINSYLRNEFEFEYSVDGEIWTDEFIAHEHIYFRIRIANISANWSDKQEIPYGKDGNNGFSPYVNSAGNWVNVDGDTGTRAQGLDGKDGFSPYISSDGNWIDSSGDTGVSALGIMPDLDIGSTIVSDSANVSIESAGLGYLLNFVIPKADKGEDGKDGDSLVWKGELTAHPNNPEYLWIYRNTTEGIVYVYDGTNWEIAVKDGQDGEGGVSSGGISINDVYTALGIDIDSGDENQYISAKGTPKNLPEQYTDEKVKEALGINPSDTSGKVLGKDGNWIVVSSGGSSNGNSGNGLSEEEVIGLILMLT